MTICAVILNNSISRFIPEKKIDTFISRIRICKKTKQNKSKKQLVMEGKKKGLTII